MPTYLLTLRAVYTPFELPTLPQLLQSLQAKFPTDTGLTVIQPRRAEQGMYKIVLQVDADNLQLPLSVGGRVHNFSLRKLTAAEEEGRLNANPRADGKLYTLYKCTSGAMFNIPNETFDAAVSAFGRLTRPCEHQKYKGSPVFNGNRYFCMVASGPMPDKVEIKDPVHPDQTYYITIGYQGKAYFCARCQKQHVGECPVKKAFYEEQQYRATQTIDKMILADSTLRQAEATGLSADIFCMSGGRVGHVAHMIKDAPNMSAMKEVIIIAGSNDIHRDSETLQEFEVKVTKGVENCQHAVFQDSKSLTFVTPPLPADLTALEKQKSDRLDVLLNKFAKTPDNTFNVIKSPTGLPMEGRHPTEAGTKALLEHINATLPIIHNRDYITSARLYGGVQTAYRYGCLACLFHLDLDKNSLCPGCAHLLAPDPSLLTPKGDTVLVPPSEVHMSESDNKRLTSAHSESTPSKMLKSNDGGHN